MLCPLLQGLISCGASLFFAASDTVTGFEMWASDGTAEGTALLGDLTRGTTVRASMITRHAYSTRTRMVRTRTDNRRT